MWPRLRDIGGWKFMSNTGKAFESGKAFIAFLTAGDPSLEVTEALIPEMAASGADLIEIGIPFSDPIAEGPVIQAADERALSSGTTTEKIFEMVTRVRRKTDVPLAFMTYMNPVYVYGVERFTAKLAACGVDTLIVPDVPFEEKAELLPSCEKYGVDLISLIAPTSRGRIEMIAKEAQGFLYCVSSLGVTGVRDSITTDIGEMIAHVRGVSDIPCAVGFGIATPAQAAEMGRYSDGVIVGSAIVKLIAQYGKECIGPVCSYIREMKEAVRRS